VSGCVLRASSFGSLYLLSPVTIADW
jgi:hypothetical protein